MTTPKSQTVLLAIQESVNSAAWIVFHIVPFGVWNAWLRFTEKTLYIELRYVFLSQLYFFAYLLILQEWNGAFFEKRQLKNLGLRVQLGHGGRPCPCPLPGSSDFVIMHVNGVHRVNVDFCDCGSAENSSPHPRVQLLRMAWFPATFERPKTAFTFDLLKLFHKVTLQGKTTLYDFYLAILQVSDSLELDKSTVSKYLSLLSLQLKRFTKQNRYSEFHRVFRIWRHLQALKHAGRGHDPAGSAATSQGELVLECPACPIPGKNLPDNWEDVKPEERYVFILITIPYC